MGDEKLCNLSRTPYSTQGSLPRTATATATLLDVLDLVLPRLIDICEDGYIQELRLACKSAKRSVDPFLRDAACIDKDHLQQVSTSNLTSQLLNLSIYKWGPCHKGEDEVRLNTLRRVLESLRSITSLGLFEMRPYLVSAFKDIALPTLTELKIDLRYTRPYCPTMNDQMDIIFCAKLPSLERLWITRGRQLRMTAIAWTRPPEHSESKLPALKELKLGSMEVHFECFEFLTTRGAPNLEVLTLQEVFCMGKSCDEGQQQKMPLPWFPKLKTIKFSTLRSSDHFSSILKMLHGNNSLENLSLCHRNAFGILRDIHLPSLLSLHLDDLAHSPRILHEGAVPMLSFNDGMEWLLTQRENFPSLESLNISPQCGSSFHTWLWDKLPTTPRMKLQHLKKLYLSKLVMEGPIPAFLGAELLPRLHVLDLYLPRSRCLDLKPMFDAAAANRQTVKLCPKLQALRIETCSKLPDPEGVDAVLSFARRCQGLAGLCLCTHAKDDDWFTRLARLDDGDGPRSPCWPNLCSVFIHLKLIESRILEKYSSDIKGQIISWPNPALQSS